MIGHITPEGVLLPGETLSSPWFEALALFVAVNSLAYAALARGETLPQTTTPPLSGYSQNTRSTTCRARRVARR